MLFTTETQKHGENQQQLPPHLGGGLEPALECFNRGVGVQSEFIRHYSESFTPIPTFPLRGGRGGNVKSFLCASMSLW